MSTLLDSTSTAPPPAAPRGRRGGRRGGRLSGLLLIAPTIVLLLTFIGALLTLLEYSFHEGNGASETIGTGSWTAFFTDGYRWDVLRETVLIGLGATVATAIIGVPTALALNQIRRPGWRAVGLFIVFAPLMTSVISRTYGWSLLLGDQGPMNWALDLVGLPPAQLLYDRPAVILALIHILLPFMVFPIMNALGQMDGATTEAARDLGAGSAVRFRRVTLPLIASGVLGGCQLVFAMAISSFATPSLLGGGRVTVLATLVYSDMNNVQWPMASVTSYVLLGLALVVLGLFIWAQRVASVPGAQGVTATASRRRLGAGGVLWLIVVDLFVLAPLLIIIISSFSSVSYGAWPIPGWSFQWYENLLSQEGLGRATLASLSIAFWSTVISVAAGTAAAVAFSRRGGRTFRAIQTFTLAPTIVPKVAAGLAAFIFLQRVGFLQGSVGIILMHAIISLPFVVVVVTAALARVDTTIEEAARELGAGPWRAFASTTLSALRPALAAAALFAFILSFDEVDMTVFLLSPGEQTLPVWMFTYMQRYQDPTIASLSTILIVGSLVLAAVAALLLGRTTSAPRPKKERNT